MRGRQRASRRVGEGGFTVIELVVVMTIIAIAFFAVRPGIVGVRRGAQQRKAVRQLVALLTSARTEAVAGGKLVRVMCDPSAGAFWAEAQIDPRADRSEFGLLRVLGREQVLLPEELFLSELVVAGQRTAGVSQDAIYFYADGRTDGAALVLRDMRGQEKVVEVAPATGKVSVSA